MSIKFKMLKMDGCASGGYEGEISFFVKEIHDSCMLVLKSETTHCMSHLLWGLKSEGLYGSGLVDSETAHLMYRVAGGFVHFIFSGSNVIVYSIPDSEKYGDRSLYSQLTVDSVLVSKLVETVKNSVTEESVFLALDGYVYVTEVLEIDKSWA